MFQLQVKAILVNIFGGIVDCAIIAKGITKANRGLDLGVPIIVRLEGELILSLNIQKLFPKRCDTLILEEMAIEKHFCVTQCFLVVLIHYIELSS